MKGKSKVHPVTGHMTQRQIASTALLFFKLSARWGWVVNATPWPRYPRERDQVPIVQEAGWAPEPAMAGVENFAPTGIRSPDRPTRSESLYRLRYPGPSQRTLWEGTTWES